MTVLRKGADGAKLARTTPIITSSESTPVAAAAAGRLASLRAMEMKRLKRLMEMERLGRPKRLMEMERFERPKRLVGMRRLLWPVRPDFFPRSGISFSGLPASSAGCPDYRGFPKIGGARLA